MRTSVIHHSIPGREVQALSFDASEAEALAREFVQGGYNFQELGIRISADAMPQMITAMDAAPNVQGPTYAAGIPTPIQFLQNWLPGFVYVVTAPRVIDEIVGIATVGDWEDEEVIQGTMEPVGLAQLYGDLTNVPLASWNLAFDRRSIVRFEEGLRVGKLEAARAAKVRVNDAAVKRNAAALALDIQRNRVAFFGYNNGGRTYGFLNDPNLPAYVNVSGGAWSGKTFQQIINDIRVAVNALVVQSGGTVRAGAAARNATPLTLVLPLGPDGFLSVTTDFGVSVAEWLEKTYPNMRIITAPELAGANGGANVFYLFAERAVDGDPSDDGGQTFMQVVPTRFMTIGAEQQVKAYVEDYGNATAGVMTKRPYLVKRYSGI